MVVVKEDYNENVIKGVVCAFIRERADGGQVRSDYKFCGGKTQNETVTSETDFNQTKGKGK